MPAWLTWLIVIVVIVAVVAVVLAMVRRRRAEQHRATAAELRQDASGQAAGLAESQRQADEARAQAELAEAEAARARERAETAAQAHQVDQAEYEDKLRVADKVDPDVNTRSKDYQPDVWTDQQSESIPQQESAEAGPGIPAEGTTSPTTTSEGTTAPTTTSEGTVPEGTHRSS